jgi:type VI protein secretion system component Hcp
MFHFAKLFDEISPKLNEILFRGETEDIFFEETIAVTGLLGDNLF